MQAETVTLTVKPGHRVRNHTQPGNPLIGPEGVTVAAYGGEPLDIAWWQKWARGGLETAAERDKREAAEAPAGTEQAAEIPGQPAKAAANTPPRSQAAEAGPKPAVVAQAPSPANGAPVTGTIQQKVE